MKKKFLRNQAERAIVTPEEADRRRKMLRQAWKLSS